MYKQIIRSLTEVIVKSITFLITLNLSCSLFCIFFFLRVLFTSKYYLIFDLMANLLPNFRGA